MDNLGNTRVEAPFQVRTSGCVRDAPYHSTGLKQDDVMITAFVAGKGKFWNGSQECQVSGGMVGFLTDMEKDLLVSDVEEPYHHYYCRFNGKYAKQMVSEIIDEQGRFFSHDNTEIIASLLHEMGLTQRQHLPDRMGKRELLLIQALVLLGGDETVKTARSLSKHSMMEYLNDRISEPTVLDAMATHFNVSKSTLCRAARKCFGATIQKTHERIKIDWAKVLLTSSNLTANEVAFRVGFQDPLYFSRVFRMATGLPPGKWRIEKTVDHRL